MTKQYIKVVPITAEQFDCSAEQLAKYQIKLQQYKLGVRPPEWYLETLEGEMLLHVGDYIATGIKGEHWVIDEKVFKATYKEMSNKEAGYNQLLRVHNMQANTIKELHQENEKLQDRIESLEFEVEMCKDENEEWGTRI